MNVLLFLLTLLPLCAEEEAPSLPTIEEHSLITASDLFAASQASSKDGYTINYRTVSMVEYIKFASKICNTNFIFNEEDLGFTVSVISDLPITPQTVMATLIQMLRIHGLMLIEEGKNLVIHKSSSVRQLATLVFEDGNNTSGAPIVTRLFRVKNANVDSLASIIKPMISDEALLEISHETRQLIVTDITANVDKVAALIDHIDAPQSPLEIQIFEAKNHRPEYLVELANQIMAPLTQGQPFHMVPQTLANAIFIVSSPELNERALSILITLDVPAKQGVLTERKKGPAQVTIVKLEHRPGNEILKGLHDLIHRMQESGMRDSDLQESIDSAQWLPDSNSILFSGTSDATDKMREFIAVLDATPEFEWGKISFFIYKPQARTVYELEKSLAEVADNLSKTKGTDPELIAALRSATINPTTQTILIAGNSLVFPRIKEILSTADIGKKEAGIPSVYIYKIQSPATDQVINSLKSFARTLTSGDHLVSTIENVKYIKETHSLYFTGPEDVLARLQQIVPQFDGGGLPPNSQFLIYKPKTQKGEFLVQSIKEMTKNFKTSHLIDPAFLRTLCTIKWIPESNTILFTGDPVSLQRVEELALSLDVPQKSDKGFFLYPPRYVTKERLESYLKQVAEKLDPGSDKDLIATIKLMQWVDPTFLFSGSESALSRLKELLAGFDISSEQTKTTKPGYFLYRLQNTSGDFIETDLDHLLKKMQSSGLKDTALARVIANIRYVKETNSLLLTGEPGAIEEAKDLIASYDYPRAPGAVATEFLLYKPQVTKISQIEKSLKEVAVNLHKADLADPNLLAAIQSMKYIETTNSLLFAGTPEALQKLQGLLREIDVPSRSQIQHVGKTNFLLYKLQHTTPCQALDALKVITTDLKKAGSTDVELISSLETAKYVRETGSLLFTGTEDALSKIHTLLEKIDVIGLGTPTGAEQPVAPTQFYVYKVQHRPGPEIQKILDDFSADVQSSGLNDPALFHTLKTMKYIEKTQSLIFTGDDKSIAHVKDLLKEFDIPPALVPGAFAAGEQPIQSIENTSFLVYKLQFHKGDEIQGALRQIAKDLITTQTSINHNLLTSINTIQWLEVTNSLLCTGDQETLTRLRELIKNLDVPLKQVFIEILILETNLVNALTFGLEWGGKAKYKNKFAGSFSNISPIETVPFDPSSFPAQLATVNATTTPTPTMVPFNNNFNFGVIGDIIKHKGQTFISLGSLLNALEDDTEITIVMTPKIIAQDSKTATIFSGSNIPFAGSFVSTTQTSGNVQQSNLEYRDVGVNLSITPVLGNSDVITLDISLDKTSTISNAAGSSISLGNGVTATGITTSRTSMQTTVHVPNGHFLVLSGFVENSNTRTKSGIPCLGGLPVIGAAFSKNNDTVVDHNIVIFMHPRIIHSLDEMKKLATDQEDYFRDQSATPFLQKNFDEAMELIKSPDDE
jgi:type III secretion protein C